MNKKQGKRKAIHMILSFLIKANFRYDLKLQGHTEEEINCIMDEYRKICDELNDRKKRY